MFAKAPMLGRVKTRLVPLLGEAGAVDLATAFLRDTMAATLRAARALEADAVLFYDPPSARRAMRAFARDGDVTSHAQRSGDLSVRLERARERLLEDGYAQLCFVGADSPTLPRAYVARAFDALVAGNDVALGPASDGGYYLIAFRADRAGLFERIDWSTERVFAQTRARAEERGYSVACLPHWYDVDDAASYARLRAELFDPSSAWPRGDDAPASRALLAPEA